MGPQMGLFDQGRRGGGGSLKAARLLQQQRKLPQQLKAFALHATLVGSTFVCCFVQTHHGSSQNLAAGMGSADFLQEPPAAEGLQRR